METFSGTVSHQLDGKNRIRIPAKYRVKLGKDYCFMARPDGCIGVYSKEAKDAVIAKMNDATTGDRRKLLAKRMVLSTIDDANEDDQGRVVLSAFYREHAHIVKEIVTIGMGDYLEIWAKEAFEKQKEEMSFDEACAILDF